MRSESENCDGSTIEIVAEKTVFTTPALNEASDVIYWI